MPQPHDPVLTEAELADFKAWLVTQLQQHMRRVEIAASTRQMTAFEALAAVRAPEPTWNDQQRHAWDGLLHVMGKRMAFYHLSPTAQDLVLGVLDEVGLAPSWKDDEIGINEGAQVYGDEVLVGHVDSRNGVPIEMIVAIEGKPTGEQIHLGIVFDRLALEEVASRPLDSPIHIRVRSTRGTVRGDWPRAQVRQTLRELFNEDDQAQEHPSEPGTTRESFRDSSASSSDSQAADARLLQLERERERFWHKYDRDPLLRRYAQYWEHSPVGRVANIEPWHAIAEQRSMLLSLLYLGTSERISDGWIVDPNILNSLRIGMQPYVFDPNLIRQELGLYLARRLDEAVPYLWTNKVSQVIRELPIPNHTLTRAGLSGPHPVMYWSFETTFGQPGARVDWMLIITTQGGLEIWMPISDEQRLEEALNHGGREDVQRAVDESRDGPTLLTAITLRHGDQWPLRWTPGTPEYVFSEFVLQHLAFLRSKVADSTLRPSSRHVRRQHHQELEKLHRAPAQPDALASYVVQLRAVERPSVPQPSTDPEARQFTRKHKWWVRQHVAVRHRGTDKEQVVFQPAHLRGPLDLPLLTKTYLVDR